MKHHSVHNNKRLKPLLLAALQTILPQYVESVSNDLNLLQFSNKLDVPMSASVLNNKSANLGTKLNNDNKFVMPNPCPCAIMFPNHIDE